MKRIIGMLIILGGLITVAEPSHSIQPNIGQPAVLCRQDHGMWRVFDHLVIVLEWCTSFHEDISPPDTIVELLAQNLPDPQTRCENKGGRFERIGNDFLLVCWNVDY